MINLYLRRALDFLTLNDTINRTNKLENFQISNKIKYFVIIVMRTEVMLLIVRYCVNNRAFLCIKTVEQMIFALEIFF